MATYKVIGIGEHGKFFDNHAYQDAVHYIFNPDKASYIGGTGVSSMSTAAEEMQKTAVNFGKDCGKRLRHSVLSFDEKEHISPEQAKEFADKIIQHYAPEYQILYSVHTNTDNPHIHFVMNQISFVDGHRYAGKKQDYYAFHRYMKRVTHLPILLSKDKEVEC